MSIDKLDFDTTANVESEWCINENLDLAYFSAFASDSVPSDTSTDMDSDPCSAMNALTSLHTPIKSSLLVCEKIGGTHNDFFEVPSKRKGQKPILFERIKTEPVACESSGVILSLFFHYRQKSCRMMERMGYDFTKESGLNFDKEKRALLCLFAPKSKNLDYKIKTRRGLCYVSTPGSSDPESKKDVYHDSSSATSL